jgi:hypothetical protein
MFFVVLAALLVPLRAENTETHTEFLPEDFVLLACLLLDPILVNLFMVHRQKVFQDRYSIATQAAISAALAIFLAYRFRLSRVAGWVASIVLLFFLLRLQVWHALRHQSASNAASLALVEPKLPIVVGQPMVFVEMNHHEEPPIASRLYYLKDADPSRQYGRSNFFAVFEAPDLMKAAGFPIPGNIEQYSTFVNRNHRFLLIADPVEWVSTKLRQDGASITYLNDYREIMPYDDSVLYLVSMPQTTGPASLQK